MVYAIWSSTLPHVLQLFKWLDMHGHMRHNILQLKVFNFLLAMCWALQPFTNMAIVQWQITGIWSDYQSSFKQFDPWMPDIWRPRPYGTGTKKYVMMMCCVPAQLIDQRGVTGRQRDVPEKSELGAIIESLWGKASIRWTKHSPTDYIPFCISLTFSSL